MEDRGALCQPRSSLLVQQAAVRDLTGGDGVDIVVETMGPATIEQSIIAAARYSDIVAAHRRGTGRPNLVIPGDVYGPKLASIRRTWRAPCRPDSIFGFC